jgi:acetyl esterase
MVLLDRLQAAVARGALALPHGVQRRILGPPVVRDGQALHVEAQMALRLLAFAGEPDLERLSPAEARARLAHDTRVFAGRRFGGVEASDVTVDGAAGPLAARLYTPREAPQDGLLVYFHGGGFVTGDLDTHDNACRFLTRAAGLSVLAVDYRRAPEHRFPAALEDALAAFRWAAAHAPGLDADPARIAVGGDSAGGNLAAGVARLTAGAGGPAPAFQLLLYPWLDLSSKHPSYALFGSGFYLAESDLDWYRRQYLADPADARDRRCSPLLADELAGVAPAYIATAGFDPLRDEAEAYARRLRAAGVRVALRRHAGLLHGFFNTVGLGSAGREAMLEAAGALRLGLA